MKFFFKIPIGSGSAGLAPDAQRARRSKSGGFRSPGARAGPCEPGTGPRLGPGSCPVCPPGSGSTSRETIIWSQTIVWLDIGRHGRSNHCMVGHQATRTSREISAGGRTRPATGHRWAAGRASGRAGASRAGARPAGLGWLVAGCCFGGDYQWTRKRCWYWKLWCSDQTCPAASADVLKEERTWCLAGISGVVSKLGLSFFCPSKLFLRGLFASLCLYFFLKQKKFRSCQMVMKPLHSFFKVFKGQIVLWRAYGLQVCKGLNVIQTVYAKFFHIQEKRWQPFDDAKMPPKPVCWACKSSWR